MEAPGLHWSDHNPVSEARACSLRIAVPGLIPPHSSAALWCLCLHIPSEDAAPHHTMPSYRAVPISAGQPGALLCTIVGVMRLRRSPAPQDTSSERFTTMGLRDHMCGGGLIRPLAESFPSSLSSPLYYGISADWIRSACHKKSASVACPLKTAKAKATSVMCWCTLFWYTASTTRKRPSGTRSSRPASQKTRVQQVRDE